MQKRGGGISVKMMNCLYFSKKEYKNNNSFVIQDDISITVGSTGTW